MCALCAEGNTCVCVHCVQKAIHVYVCTVCRRQYMCMCALCAEGNICVCVHCVQKAIHVYVCTVCRRQYMCMCAMCAEGNTCVCVHCVQKDEINTVLNTVTEFRIKKNRVSGTPRNFVWGGFNKFS